MWSINETLKFENCHVSKSLSLESSVKTGLYKHKLKIVGDAFVNFSASPAVENITSIDLVWFLPGIQHLPLRKLISTLTIDSIPLYFNRHLNCFFTTWPFLKIMRYP